VLIVPQRQTVLVAKQAAYLDVPSADRFRLGVGIGWNKVELVRLNEDFHNRGRRSEEQLRVMQALWAEPHVDIEGSGITSMTPASIPCRTRAVSRSGSGGIMI
jgi:alkanesulfonate monooxygenase SsuD/methylene tetrahydromethanopterin reductase-like flavin-dependent oxidoreductase (luciferase family)